MYNKFIDSNNICPICNNKLSLYISFEDNLAKYKDDRFYLTNKYVYSELNHNLYEYNENFYLKISPTIEHNFPFQEKELYFFYICNVEGIQMSFPDEFEVNAYKACYYKSSDVFELKQNSLLPRNNFPILMRDESFSLKEQDFSYFLNLNYEESKMTYWSYNNLNQNNFIEKEFNIPNNFSFNKDNILKKFKLWNNFI